MSTKKTVFITGASSGIGHHTALAYAEHYTKKLSKTHALTLILTARRIERLEEVRRDITTTFPDVKVEVFPLDVTKSEDVFSVFKSAVERVGRIDVVLVNSGIGDGGAVGGWKSHQAQENCIKTNVIGAMATVNVAVEHMKEVGGGQIVAIGSVAAYRGCPGIASYGASKAALHTYIEAVRLEVARHKISVSIIHPGFIDSDINRHVPNRPFLITARRGGEIVLAHIERKTSVAIIPFFPWAFVARLMTIVPAWLIAFSWGGNGLAKE
ncbi:hypothetical protein HDU97_007306 [Phlyctochytrium planicorne]|nr:hypothetical protein HDU97_007306 [Phlyctochytrium planicorne]